ncbi:peptidase S1 domain-containing protein [Caerostris extrusa]|uniref:Peptidase S1 domain-containing protein n=1 Tax=Caerostris extrusa TaxID=172846 RepID=A0AAV4QQJ2_CAEEX|nr:peptidase S1 domain-containing protein [Caerostris extrusa]
MGKYKELSEDVLKSLNNRMSVHLRSNTEKHKGLLEDVFHNQTLIHLKSGIEKYKEHTGYAIKPTEFAISNTENPVIELKASISLQILKTKIRRLFLNLGIKKTDPNADKEEKGVEYHLTDSKKDSEKFKIHARNDTPDLRSSKQLKEDSEYTEKNERIETAESRHTGVHNEFQESMESVYLQNNETKNTDSEKSDQKISSLSQIELKDIPLLHFKSNTEIKSKISSDAQNIHEKVQKFEEANSHFRGNVKGILEIISHENEPTDVYNKSISDLSELRSAETSKESQAKIKEQEEGEASMHQMFQEGKRMLDETTTSTELKNSLGRKIQRSQSRKSSSKRKFSVENRGIKNRRNRKHSKENSETDHQNPKHKTTSQKPKHKAVNQKSKHQLSRKRLQRHHRDVHGLMTSITPLEFRDDANTGLENATSRKTLHLKIIYGKEETFYQPRDTNPFAEYGVPPEEDEFEKIVHDGYRKHLFNRGKYSVGNLNKNFKVFKPEEKESSEDEVIGYRNGTSSQRQYIIGGRNVETPWPWMVNANFSFLFTHSQNILRKSNNNIQIFLPRFAVVVGSLYRFDRTPEPHSDKVHRVKKVFLHKGFSMDCYCNDIAVLRLRNPWVQTTCLNASRTSILQE